MAKRKRRMDGSLNNWVLHPWNATKTLRRLTGLLHRPTKSLVSEDRSPAPKHFCLLPNNPYHPYSLHCRPALGSDPPRASRFLAPFFSRTT